MGGYTKLFSRLLDSTVWREDDKTRILWITMLALADQDGHVFCTIPGLADRARITLAECESALEKFQQPDKYSWSKEGAGRKIRIVDGGWFLINHAKYRALMSEEDRREKTRIRVAKWREKQSCNAPVTESNAGNDKQKQKQIQIQKQEESKPCAPLPSFAPDFDQTKVDKLLKNVFVRPSLEEIKAYCLERKNSVDPQKWFDYYTSNGWRVGRNPMKDWRAAVRTWEKNGFSNGNGNHGPASPGYESQSVILRREREARKAKG